MEKNSDNRNNFFGCHDKWNSQSLESFQNLLKIDPTLEKYDNPKLIERLKKFCMEEKINPCKIYRDRATNTFYVKKPDPADTSCNNSKSVLG